MATGNTDDGLFDLPFPIAADPVNVHEDIESLARRLMVILPPLGLSQFQLGILNNSGENLPAGTPVYATGHTTKTTIAKALPLTESPILGLLKTPVANGSDGIAVVAGVMENINTSGFENGDVLYVGTSGGLTNVRPTGGSGAVGVVAHASNTGVIIVEAKGNGTWGALKDGLS